MAMRMRTIKQAAEEVRQADPNTAVTERAIRRWVTAGTVPSVTVGGKYLVALENLEDFLGGSQARIATIPPKGEVRRVEVAL